MNVGSRGWKGSLVPSQQDSSVHPRRSDHTAADSHDLIQVRDARENNLTGVSLDIPKRRLTVFTGVSGSGKSSLVFDTIAAESRRLINETYTAFLQGFMPSLSRPDVDALRNLSAAIIVDQERMGANARSTVGTATDAYTMLRIVFSRVGHPVRRSRLRLQLQHPRGHVPGVRGARQGVRHRRRRAGRPGPVAERGRDQAPRLRRGHLARGRSSSPPASSTRTSSCATTRRSSGRTSCTSRRPR